LNPKPYYIHASHPPPPRSTSSTGRCSPSPSPSPVAKYRWGGSWRSPLTRARQVGTRICQDEVVLRDSPMLARLVKRSPNDLLCGTSII